MSTSNSSGQHDSETSKPVRLGSIENCCISRNLHHVAGVDGLFDVGGQLNSGSPRPGSNSDDYIAVSSNRGDFSRSAHYSGLHNARSAHNREIGFEINNSISKLDKRHAKSSAKKNVSDFETMMEDLGLNSISNPDCEYLRA
mmetsp:Transcript_19953/g.55375  ORF Transcript_19953/g.55375 Transcript_19953/m.55375 type:complete len:142 (+) Transcript_19953:80-505(+)